MTKGFLSQATRWMVSFIKKEYEREEGENEFELHLESGDLEMTEKHKIVMSTLGI